MIGMLYRHLLAVRMVVIPLIIPCNAEAGGNHEELVQVSEGRNCMVIYCVVMWCAAGIIHVLSVLLL